MFWYIWRNDLKIIFEITYSIQKFGPYGKLCRDYFFTMLTEIFLYVLYILETLDLYQNINYIILNYLTVI